jgi:hypothetical protein
VNWIQSLSRAIDIIEKDINQTLLFHGQTISFGGSQGAERVCSLRLSLRGKVIKDLNVTDSSSNPR